MLKNQSKLAVALCSMSLAILTFAGTCVIGPVYVDDRAHVDAEVVAADGYTPVSNLRLDFYDLSVRFYDGTRITERFSGDYRSPLETNYKGFLSFLSEDLNWESYDSDYSCTYVCVDEDAYGYCYEYVEDCYGGTYRYDLDVYDVVSTSSQISYQIGSSFITSLGERLDAYAESSTTWYQNDVFVTPIDPYYAAAVAVQSSQTIPIRDEVTVSVQDDQGNRIEKTIPVMKRYPKVLSLENDLQLITSEKLQKVKNARQKLNLPEQAYKVKL